jgi:hypothetical protein
MMAVLFVQMFTPTAEKSKCPHAFLNVLFSLPGKTSDTWRPESNFAGTLRESFLNPQRWGFPGKTEKKGFPNPTPPNRSLSETHDTVYDTHNM